MSNRQDIEFKTRDGLTLRGWFYPAGKKAPTVILTHGLGSIINFYLDDFAARFQEAGFAALVYDNRNWGLSDGLPRQEVDSYNQHQDYIDAFDYAASREDVDENRIAYWGTSYSGGNTIMAAAIDHRIKAAIIQGSMVSGEISSQAFSSLIPHLFNDRVARRDGADPVYVPIIPESAEAAKSGTAQTILNHADAFEFFTTASRRGGTWSNQMTMQSMFIMLSNEPRAFIHRIAPTPFCMVIPEFDTTVSTASQLAAAKDVLEPKEIHVVRGAGHFDVYSGKHFETNIKIQIAFLKKYL
ncbi:hypothetical protein B7463_g4601, partial [Scytalidium lignicola]